MELGLWDTLYNIVLLLFWSRVWVGDAREGVLNPYLHRVRMLQDLAIHFLRPVFVGVPPRLVALVGVLFLLALRGVAAGRLHGWVLTMGFMAREFGRGGIAAAVVFSALSFGLFLFSVWGLSLIYLVPAAMRVGGSAGGAMGFLTRPFGRLPAKWQPPVLLACGMALAALLVSLGTTPGGAADAGVVAWAAEAHAAVKVVRLAIIAISGWVSLLGLIQSALVALIVASWVGLFANAPGLSGVCHEWINLIIGPLRNYPLRVGMLDLTPLVFMFALGFVHNLLHGVLVASYLALG